MKQATLGEGTGVGGGIGNGGVGDGARVDAGVGDGVGRGVSTESVEFHEKESRSTHDEDGISKTPQREDYALANLRYSRR